MPRIDIYATIITIVAATAAQAEEVSDKSASTYFGKTKDLFSKINIGKTKRVVEDGANFYRNGVNYGAIITSKSTLTEQQTQSAGTSGMDAVRDVAKITVTIGGRGFSTAGAAAMIVPLHDGREVLPASIKNDNAIARLVDVGRNGSDPELLEREHVQRLQNNLRIEANYKGSITDTITSRDNFFNFLSRITSYQTDTAPKLDNEIRQKLATLSRFPSRARSPETSIPAATPTTSEQANLERVPPSQPSGNLWKYIQNDVVEACEPINFAGENWIDALIKDEIGSGPECQLVAKDVTPTAAAYTVECVYQHEGCSQCVDITTSNVRPGGIAASKEIYRSNVHAEKDGEDRILLTRQDSRGDGSNGVFERCQR